MTKRSIAPSLLLSLFMSGCGYHLAGMDMAPLRDVALSQQLSGNNEVRRALNRLNIDVVPTAEIRIQSADCNRFSIEDSGDQETIDLTCTVRFIEGNNAPAEFSEHRVIRIDTENQQTEATDLELERIDLLTEVFQLIQR